MANYIAIEINSNEVLVSAARSVGKRFQLTSMFTVAIQTDETNEMIGESLKKAMHEHSVARSNVIAVVNRQQIEMREVHVPPAPLNELPDLVRFQARNEFTALSEQWAVDFVPFQHVEGQQQRVLASAISPQLLAQTKTIVETAGLKLAKIVVGPYTSCQLLRSEISDKKNRFLLFHNDEHFGLSITEGSQLVATRAVHTTPDTDLNAATKPLIGEIRRTLASLTASAPDIKIDEFILCISSSGVDELQSSLQTAFEMPVRVVDPMSLASAQSSVTKSLPDSPGRFAAIVGALLQESSGEKHQVDFLHPRKAKAKTRDMTRVWLYGALAALLLVSALFTGWWMLNSVDQSIARLNKQLKELKFVNDGDDNRPGIDQIIGEVNEIDEWKAADINWLDTLANVSDSYLTADDVIVDSMRLTTGKAPGITISGRISGTDIENELKKNLRSKGYTNVVAGETTELNGDDYKFDFHQTILMTPDVSATVTDQNESARDAFDMSPDTGDNDESMPQDKK